MIFSLKNSLKVLVTIGVAFQSTLLFSFTPGKWNPMDAYVTQAQKGGPRALIVYDATGKIRQTAEFQYDANGRLARELYLNASGKRDGSTSYEYRGSRITGEKLFNRKGDLVERKVYLYSSGRLSAIQVFDKKGQEIMQVDYTRKGNQIHVAEEKRDKALDRVLFRYKDDRLNMLEVKDDQGKVFSKTKFEYGPDGKLLKRERFQGGRRFLCKYRYNKRGAVAGYEYLVFNPEKNQWQLQKRLAFRF